MELLENLVFVECPRFFFFFFFCSFSRNTINKIVLNTNVSFTLHPLMILLNTYCIMLQAEGRIVNQYVFKKWNRKQCLPQGVKAFMDLIAVVEKAYFTDIYHPIVVKCL